MGRKIVMGIDGGTGGIRVGLYDLQGHELGFASTEYKTYHQHPGWAEQDPMDWWRSLAASIKKVTRVCSIQKGDILAMSLDTTSCSVLLSKNDGTPIRNSLIWMDVRASREAEFISNCGDEALKFNGYGKASAEWMPSKALWLKRNEPENYAQAEKVCEYTDWIMYKLTGIWTGNDCNMAVRWYYDGPAGGFPTSFYEKIGLGDVLEKFPQDVRHIGDCVSTLTEEAAEFLGLDKNIIVGQGGIDAYIGNIGLGVVKPGRIAVITGSSHLIMGFTDKPAYSKGIFGPFPNAVITGLWVAEGGQTSSGSIIEWFRKHFCRDLDLDPENKGIDAYGYLTPDAEKIPPGSEGLLVLDYWQGNRTPFTDSEVRGMIYGLSLNHTRTHVFRAIMEGIAFGTENVFASFRENGYPVNEVYMGGGTTRSDLFMQIHADVSNVIINVPENPQVPCVGSAVLAAVAAGEYKSIEDAAENMVRFNKRILPNQENHEIYARIFAQYKKAYPQFGSWMQETSRLS